MRQPRFGDVFEWRYPGNEMKVMYLGADQGEDTWTGFPLDLEHHVRWDGWDGHGVRLPIADAVYSWVLVSAAE